jgi:flavin reductase (DIM6/NTAB) family NADH-FMN oxidoreductase RutF
MTNDGRPPTHSEVLDAIASGVAVLTGLSRSGDVFALAAATVTSYSVEPPSILACVRREDAEALSGRFAVNVLSAPQRRLAEDLRDGATLPPAEVSGRRSVPVIRNAAIHLLCRNSFLRSHGDRTIVVGEVEACAVADIPPLIGWRGELYPGVGEV